jgi:hypothetical protein
MWFAAPCEMALGWRAGPWLKVYEPFSVGVASRGRVNISTRMGLDANHATVRMFGNLRIRLGRVRKVR